jgi:PPOX class probable F420-dependent enzyme
MTTTEWQTLTKARYLNLESLKRDGTAVRTPLWFAPDADGTFYIYSQAEAYKVKRLRRTPACRVAACDMRGNVSGPWLEARAEILSGAAAAHGMALLDRRYWPWKQMLGLLGRLRPGAARAVIALRPAGGG